MSKTSAHAAKDDTAFAILVRANQSRLRSFLLRLTKGDATLADDLAQDTFLESYRKLSQYRGDAPFGNWLLSIGYSKFLMHIRRPQMEYLAESEDFPAPDTYSSSEAKIDLENAFYHLNIQERAALTLCYAHQYSQEEAAIILEINLNTLKSRVLRGREKLEALLRKWRYLDD